MQHSPSSWLSFWEYEAGTHEGMSCDLEIFLLDRKYLTAWSRQSGGLSTRQLTVKSRRISQRTGGMVSLVMAPVFSSRISKRDQDQDKHG